MTLTLALTSPLADDLVETWLLSEEKAINAKMIIKSFMLGRFLKPEK
jgi:hypothetical protein